MIVYSGIFCGSKYILSKPNILGVDFDGTLAKSFSPFDPKKVGAPVPRMIIKVRQQLLKGRKVVILTARMHSSHTPQQLEYTRKLIEAWCQKYLGQKLAITSEKHPNISEIWDDRAKGVKRDKGEFIK